MNRRHQAAGPVGRKLPMVVALLMMSAISSCTGPPDQESVSGTTVPASEITAEPPAESLSSPAEPTPTTQAGVLTGPGVDDTYITIGSLVETGDSDRGFSDGLALWASSINASGGVCGRWVQVAYPTDSDLVTGYRELGSSVLGFATNVSSTDTAAELADLIGADQIPALTAGGTTDDLLAGGPIVLGPTDAILAINALDHLVSSEVVVAGDTVGVFSDGSPAALDSLAGLVWYADRAGLFLQVSSDIDKASVELAGVPASLIFADPETTARLAADLPITTQLVTTLAGYRSDLIPAADARHLQVVLATPVYGSDHPGAMAVANAFAAAGMTDPGPLLFAGYATGATWQRLLSQACDNAVLTRQEVIADLSTIGPASVDGMFGGSDPAQVVQSGLPASRSAAIAQADPAAPTGLTEVTGLFAADGIDEYPDSP